MLNEVYLPFSYIWLPLPLRTLMSARPPRPKGQPLKHRTCHRIVLYYKHHLNTILKLNKAQQWRSSSEMAVTYDPRHSYWYCNDNISSTLTGICHLDHILDASNSRIEYNMQNTKAFPWNMKESNGCDIVKVYEHVGKFTIACNNIYTRDLPPLSHLCLWGLLDM